MELFPITSATLWTLAGAAVWAVLMTTWVKHYLPDWRWTNLLALGLTLVAMVPIGLFLIEAGSAGERIVQSVLMSVIGTSLATWGREGLLNLVGLAGVGPRSDKALAQK